MCVSLRCSRLHALRAEAFSDQLAVNVSAALHCYCCRGLCRRAVDLHSDDVYAAEAKKFTDSCMSLLPSVFWRCWLGGRKGIRPVKTEWWHAGVVVCLERGADLHVAQLMPLPLTVSCFSKIQIGFTFLVPAHLSSPGQRAIKWVCACICPCWRQLAHSDCEQDSRVLLISVTGTVFIPCHQ